MGSFEFVDVDTARNARGLRLVVLADVPSPWSIAARSILELKQLPTLLVRLSTKDETVRSWTGVRNAPVLLYQDDPPRSGWAEILTLAERLRPEIPLVPGSPRERALLFGLSHELMGEGGLLWSARLLTIDASLTSQGGTGWPVRVARFLGRRYGYGEGCAEPARARVLEVLQLLDEQLASTPGGYYFGDRRTALDVYSAAAMHLLAPLPYEQCPMHPVVRMAFESLQPQLGAALPRSLVEHRDHMYSSVLSLPLQL